MTLKLPTQVIINHVEEIQSQFNEIMNSGDAIVIDISGVEKADTAGLQLLCVIQKSLLGVSQQIIWQGTSSALVSTAKLIGVNEFLKL